MSQTAAILVTLNNYVHDVATGLLIVSALLVAWCARDLGERPEPAAVALFRRTYARCVRFVLGSIAVIVATGAVRAVYFLDLEWHVAHGKGLVPVLLLKHVLIFTMLGVGVYAWRAIRRRMRALERGGAA